MAVLHFACLPKHNSEDQYPVRRGWRCGRAASTRVAINANGVREDGNVLEAMIAAAIAAGSSVGIPSAAIRAATALQRPEKITIKTNAYETSLLPLMRHVKWRRGDTESGQKILLGKREPVHR